MKRLGIDESVDYTKPLVDPSMMPLPPKFSPGNQRPRSVSSEKSDDGSGSIRLPPTNTISPSMKALNAHNHSSSTHKDDSCNSSIASDRSPRRQQSKSPDEDAPSDLSNKNSTNHNNTSSNNNNNSSSGKLSSLSALSSMFESIGGGGVAGGDGKNSPNGSTTSTHTNSSNNNNSTHHHHPLAALQKLCDKTDNVPVPGGVNNGSNSRPTSTSSSNAQSSPGIKCISNQIYTGRIKIC